jgi:hypothetical protein
MGGNEDAEGIVFCRFGEGAPGRTDAGHFPYRMDQQQKKWLD